MNLSAVAATSGARGVDCVTILTPASAARLKADGHDFAVRYLGSVSTTERDAILGAGLALLFVGYSRKPGWSPSANLGAQDGATAVAHAKALGLPTGLSLFCDLETPNPTSASADIIAYVNAWSTVVQGAGYIAGLYVGFGCGLTSQELYDLKVTGYWHSCSYVPDVAVRGYQMIQDTKANQIVDGVQVDTDVIKTDALGSVPMWLIDADQLQAA
jgi:hypothetical protein